MPTMTASKRHRHTGLPSFEEAAAPVMQGIKDAFEQLIACIPGPISKAFDLQKVLGVDPKLASRVFRVARAEKPLAAGAYVPSRVSMERVLKAASKQRVPATVIERVSGAFDAFEQLVADHAGDRESFDSMISAIASLKGEESSIDIQQRKAAYLANSHILGVQARTRMNCFIYKPDPKRDTCINIRGLVDLRWLRAAHAPFTISRVIVRDTTSGHEEALEITAREPLDASDSPNADVALMKEFCSQPLPQIQTIVRESGMMYTQIVGEHVGKASLTTCIIGDVMRDLPEMDFSLPDEHFDSSVLVRTPCEVLIHDVLAYEGGYGPLSPSVTVLSDHQCADGSLMGRESDVLPMAASVKCLGKGTEVMHTRDVPRYAEMVQYAMDRLGWDSSKFEVYRCRIEYPVMPSTVNMRLR